VIPNGVDFDGIRKIALGTRRGSNRIVYVGRLVGYKKVEQVLELVLRLRRLGLNVGADIVGDGPERVPLESLASKMGVTESVRFWGFLKRYEDVARIVSSGTVFVNPSIFEGFGLTLLEAMAAGTPVVAYGLESYREYARDGVNCLLARPYDFEEFTDNVKRIIVDETVANGISRMGIETASQLGWAKMAQRMRDIYLSVAS
jgi:glycosyltransferase involved in cell wall biosynthesis